MSEPGKNDDSPYNHEAWLKHLEFIQSVISRLANNSFLVKGWALTVSGALFGFAASHLSWEIAVVGLLPVVAFWYLDSYFLMSERLYRALYYDVARQSDSVPHFSLDPSPYRNVAPLRVVLLSRTIIVFYGALIVAGIILTISMLVHQLTN